MASKSLPQFERALYITKAEHLAYHETKYTRLYFGSEFCQRLLPERKALEQVLAFVKTHRLEFTFLTPYATDEGLTRIDWLLRILHAERPESEVVFNDWGVFRRINAGYDSFVPVMGRLLSKMKRGPRLMRFLEIAPKETNDYYQTCSLEISVYQRFLASHRIQRAELDIPLQGIALNLNGTGLRASLYTPYAYVTTTRLCLASGCEDPVLEDQVDLRPCGRECQKYTFLLRHPVLPIPLIGKGNSQFIRNETVPEYLADRGIDRIVFEPEVPM